MLFAKRALNLVYNRPNWLNYASSGISRKSAKNARLAKLCQKSASTFGKSQSPPPSIFSITLKSQKTYLFQWKP